MENIVSENRGRYLIFTEETDLMVAPECAKSPLNLVLCGRSGAWKKSAANAILGQRKFSPPADSECVKHQGEVCGRRVTLVELPGLDGKPQEAANKESLRSISLCDPEGVHAFVLVLPLDPLTDEDKRELKTIQNIFSSRANDFTMILFTVKSNPNFPANMRFLQENRDIQELCRSCGERYVVFDINNKQQVSEVLDTVEKMRVVGSRGFTKEMTAKPRLNRIVMFGKSEKEKTTLSNFIIGKMDFSYLNTSRKSIAHGEWRKMPVTVVKTADVFNLPVARVSLVELPALYGKRQEAVMEESFRCISLCDPEGVHAFILVLPLDSLTDTDKGELETIQNTFSSRVNDFTMILFTVASDPTVPDVVDFLRRNRDVQELIQSFGGRYVVFNVRDKHQVSEVLDTAEKMRVVGYRSFTKDMMARPRLNKVARHVSKLEMA
eukprot:superscaffoldBa00004585_g19123